MALVTGAGQTPGTTTGNGRAIAVRFAREGARVICLDRNRERAQDTVDLIAADGGQAMAVDADITDDQQCRAAVSLATETWGPLHVLINNVGIGVGADAPVHRLGEDTFDLVMEVNLKGAWLMTRAVLDGMRDHGAGSIVNISSLASIAGATQMAYEISKAGVNRMTTSVAQSQAKYGIRCNAVLPGLMDTPMAVEGIAASTGRTREDVRAERDALIPLGRRMGTADDTANAALFLASDEARFITGILLPVDGGLGLR